jgi:lysophospholipase L1-like esterase
MFLPRCLPRATCAAAGLVLSLAGGLPAAEPKDPAERTIELEDGDRIIFFGDSLTEQGTGPDGYVTLVRNALKEKHPKLKLEVDSVATGGHKVTDLLKRVDKDVIAKKPTIVFIQIGVNDAGAGVTKDQFREQLEELIGRLQDGGAKVVLCSLTSLGEKHDGTNRIDGRLEELAGVARKLAKDLDIPLNDLRKAFVRYWKQHNPDNKDKGILTYDGNHFNETGQKFVAEQMLGKLE